MRTRKTRAGIEFPTTVSFCQYNLTRTAKDEAEFNRQCDEMRAKLAQVESQLAGPYFNGTDLSLADAAFAPLFMRLSLLEGWHAIGLYDGLPKVKAWAEALLSRPAVRGSVVPEFADLYRSHIGNAGCYGSTVFGAG